MLSPSSSTLPVVHPPSLSSCIRLSVRRKVLLPQPDGPISACTRLAGNSSDTFFTAVNFPYMAVSLLVAIRTGVSAIDAVPSDREARAQAQQEDDEDQHQRRRPGELVPLFIRPRRVVEDDERQRGHRL